MVSKNLPDWCQNCTPSQLFTLGGYKAMGGSLSTQVIIWSDTMLDWSIGECIGFNNQHQ